jgi:hypothetical protein
MTSRVLSISAVASLVLGIATGVLLVVLLSYSADGTIGIFVIVSASVSTLCLVLFWRERTLFLWCAGWWAAGVTLEFIGTLAAIGDGLVTSN